MMKLTKDEANKIVWGDHEDWEIVPDTRDADEPYKQMMSVEGVFLHKPTGKTYSLCWCELTDDWGCDPFEYCEPEPCEVKQETVTVTKWVKV